MISSAIWDKSALVNYLLLVNNTHTKISLQMNDKQGVFGCLPFRIVVKTLRSCKLGESKYCYGILKLSVMHYQVLLSSFSYMGMS